MFDIYFWLGESGPRVQCTKATSSYNIFNHLYSILNHYILNARCTVDCDWLHLCIMMMGNTSTNVWCLIQPADGMGVRCTKAKLLETMLVYDWELTVLWIVNGYFWVLWQWIIQAVTFDVGYNLLMGWEWAGGSMHQGDTSSYCISHHYSTLDHNILRIDCTLCGWWMATFVYDDDLSHKQ